MDSGLGSPPDFNMNSGHRNVDNLSELRAVAIHHKKKNRKATEHITNEKKRR